MINQCYNVFVVVVNLYDEDLSMEDVCERDSELCAVKEGKLISMWIGGILKIRFYIMTILNRRD